MTKEEQVIFDRLKENLMERNFGVSINFNSLRNAIAATVAKEVCNLAITAKKTDDEIIEKINKILVAMTKMNQRLSALENKQPTYVPPPVYGPITYQCPHCGVVLHGSEYHVCGDFTHLILDNQT